MMPSRALLYARAAGDAPASEARSSRSSIAPSRNLMDGGEFVRTFVLQGCDAKTGEADDEAAVAAADPPEPRAPPPFASSLRAPQAATATSSAAAMKGRA